MESYDAGRHRFEGRSTSVARGAFGYTVRILPQDERLATTAELGLVTTAG